MKLSRFGPKSRTVLITTIVLMLALTISSMAMAKEIRVYPTSVSGVLLEADLIACVTGLAPIAFGPDTGQVSAPGDTCVLTPGTYFPAFAVAPWVAGDVPILLPNLTVRSSNGRNTTIVLGQFIITAVANGVTIGGPSKDQGLTIVGGGQWPVVGTFPGHGIRVLATENITIQNDYIGSNFGYFSTADGIRVMSAASIENFTITNNIITNNNNPATFVGFGNGLTFANAGSVGRRGIDRNIIIERNTFDSNFLNNILFINVGSIEQTAILNNKILNAVFANGINVLFPVTDIRDVIIAYNTVQNSWVFGMLFANGARIENLTISDNRGDTPSQGITANGLAGVVFANGGAIRDSIIDNNAINSNGSMPLGLSIAGVLFLNGGDLQNMQFTGNEVRQNTAAVSVFGGVFRFGFPGAEFSDSLVADNAIRNNGGFFGGAGGFVDFEFGRIDNITFSNNDVRENGGALVLSAGIGLVSLFNDVSAISFSGDQFNKNGVVNLAMFSLLNDISEITLTDVTSNEAQGLSFIGMPIFFPGNGDGVTILTTIGDIDTVTITNGTFDNNGGAGVTIQALFPTVIVPVLGAPGDVDNIVVKDSEFNYNGTRAPIGRGVGLYIGGQTVRNVTIDPSVADYNNDHGVQITSGRDLMDIKISDSEFSHNDRNVDTVGDGISLSASENLDTVEISGSKANSNNSGIRISVQDRIGRKITIADNPEINDNRDTGILISAARDLADVGIQGNSLNRNLTGLQLLVNSRGSDIDVSGNKIAGKDGQGTGVLVDSSGVTLHDNAIRRTGTGILVRKVEDNSIHQNNVARNEDFGVNASALNPGQEIDATDNWWGEPSGPKHSTNSNGIGDRVSDKVVFDPWLGEPVCTTALICPSYEFTIDAFNVPANVDVDVEVEFTATITNNGTEEGSREINLTITNTADGSIVVQKSVTKTINPAATTDISFKQTFARAGVYDVTISTQDDSKSGTITVTGGAMPWVCQYAAKTGDAMLVEGGDLIAGIQDYAGGLLDGSQLITLIQYYATDTPCDQPLPGGSAAAALAAAPFSVESVGFAGNAFVAEGVGIAAIDVAVYDLAGRVVFSGSAAGNALAFNGLSDSGQTLANGIYLYTVKAYGLNGGVAQSRVNKLAFLR